MSLNHQRRIVEAFSRLVNVNPAFGTFVTAENPALTEAIGRLQKNVQITQQYPSPTKKSQAPFVEEYPHFHAPVFAPSDGITYAYDHANSYAPVQGYGLPDGMAYNHVKSYVSATMQPMYPHGDWYGTSTQKGWEVIN
jgi:hypothetical protein